jgi:2-iminobutanoate/2-iminopropanoate deaminase
MGRMGKAYSHPANANQESSMPPIQHFAAPSGVKSPPLSFAARTGDLLFVSGIPGFDDKGALPDGFEAQFGFVVRNVKRVLDEAGATFRDLVKVNVLLTRATDVAPMNVLYASAFGPAPYPARTTCVVQALPDPKMLIEIECVASLARR